jgi:cytochrome c553
VYAQGIVKRMTGNPSFPDSASELAAVGTAIVDLQTAEAAALARTKGAVATRNEKRKALVALLHGCDMCHHRQGARWSPDCPRSAYDARASHPLRRRPQVRSRGRNMIRSGTGHGKAQNQA